MTVRASATSFTRPGFGELVSAPPADDRGHNDVGKLGFFLVRVRDDGARVHFIRTNGLASLPGETGPGETRLGETSLRQRVVTRLSRDLLDSPLGLTLRHPLVQVTDVPSAWPSLVRQRVRNDYPLLSCLELGVRYVRVPLSDLADEVQRRGLALLREEGVQVSAVVHWADSVDLAEVARACRDRVDQVELQLLGGPLPSALCLEQISRWSASATIPLALSAALPGEQYPGRQLPRTRLGYRLDELARLDGCLARAKARVGRVLCRVGPAESVWDMVKSHLAPWPFQSIEAIDWLVELPAGDPAVPCREEGMLCHVWRAVSLLSQVSCASRMR